MGNDHIDLKNVKVKVRVEARIDISEMPFLNGKLCQLCGILLNQDPPGHPVTCSSCQFDIDATEAEEPPFE